MKWTELPLLGVDSRLYDDDPSELTYSMPMGRVRPLKSTGSACGENDPVYWAWVWVLALIFTEYWGLVPLL